MGNEKLDELVRFTQKVMDELAVVDPVSALLQLGQDAISVVYGKENLPVLMEIIDGYNPDGSPDVIREVKPDVVL